MASFQAVVSMAAAIIIIIIAMDACIGQSLPSFSYGQRFPGKIPTGRFSDGMLVPDLLASALGIKDSVPPFLQPYLPKEELLTGVSFASAGSGLDELTTIASRVIPMSQQVTMFQKYIEMVKGIAGEEEAERIINHAFVVISAAPNDFIFNYYDIPSWSPGFLQWDVYLYK